MTKLEKAHERAARVAKLSGGSILVGLSGKDSFVTLDIAAQHFEHVACFHMYFVPGLSCEKAPLEAMAAKYKAPLYFVPHPEMCRLMKHAVLRPHLTKVSAMPTLKKADSERLARQKASMEWIAYGERLSDSFARRLFWRKLDGVYEQGKRCTFICDWLNADVASYTRAKNLPQPCTFGATRGHSSEFSLEPRILTWLHEHHPADYARVLRVFPAAGATLREGT